jgi:hypothetical protein
MARFSKNTILQLGGFDSDVIAEELLYGQDTYWNVTVTDGTTDNLPLDLTGWSFEFRLIRRQITSIEDTRHGLELVDLRPVNGAAVINLDTSVKCYDPTNGQVRLIIDDSAFSQFSPAINTNTPPVYTGYFGAMLPAVGNIGDVDYIPAQMKKILLCFIVRSDGISAQMV